MIMKQEQQIVAIELETSFSSIRARNTGKMKIKEELLKIALGRVISHCTLYYCNKHKCQVQVNQTGDDKVMLWT